MTTPERTAVASHIAVIVLCGTVAVCAVGLTVAFERVTDGVTATLANVNRPCKGPAGPDACGALAQVNKTSIAAGDVANAAAKQVEQSGVLITATTRNLDAVGASVSGLTGHLTKTADALAGTAKALTGTSQAATTTIGTANTSLTRLTGSADVLLGNANSSVAAMQPLLGRSTLFVDHLDALATNPAIPTLETNLANITTTGEHMLQTGDAVETKLAKCTLHSTFSCVFKSDLLFAAQVTGYALR